MYFFIQIYLLNLKLHLLNEINEIKYNSGFLHQTVLTWTAAATTFVAFPSVFFTLAQVDTGLKYWVFMFSL